MERTRVTWSMGPRTTARPVWCVASRDSLDDAQLQQWAENTFSPPPTFRYSEVVWDASKTVGIVTVLRVPDYPHVVTSNLGGVLFEGQVWFRRGSKNTVALREELRRMILGDVPFKIARMNDPVMKELEAHYRALGRELGASATHGLRQLPFAGVRARHVLWDSTRSVGGGGW